MTIIFISILIILFFIGTDYKSFLLRLISTKYPVHLYGCRSADCGCRSTDCEREGEYPCEDKVFSKPHFNKIEQEYTFYYNDANYLFYKHKYKIRFLKVRYYYGV